MNNNKSLFNAHSIVVMGLMIALSIVATRFLSITTPIIRIGFGFVPVVISAMYLGPTRAGIVAAIADVVGFSLFPKGTFYPGFTLTAFLGAFIGGLFFEGNKALNKINIIIGSIVVTFVCDALLNTLWISHLANNITWAFYSKSMLARLPGQGILLMTKIIFTLIFAEAVFKRFRMPNVERIKIS